MNTVKRRWTSAAVAAVTFAVALFGPVTVGHAFETIPPPDADPFYALPSDLADSRPGDVLRSRTVDYAPVGALAIPLKTRQVFYRTTREDGQAGAAVATVIRPLNAQPGKLVSYQTFYDGLGDICDPSYTIRGGDPNNKGAALDYTFLNGYLALGYTVVTADYEQLQRAYGAGRMSGIGVLDGIRAAKQLLGLPAETRVAMVGYSGGAIASEYAAEVAPSYAPELNLVGTAVGGPPVHFPHTLAYIDGTTSWSGAILTVMTGLDRSYDLSLASYLSADGLAKVNWVSDRCLDPKNPYTRLADDMRPEYADIYRVMPLAQVLNEQIMGRHGTPWQPMLFGVGNSDGTGDGVMIAADVQALAYDYCERGVPVQFHEYTGLDHYGAAATFEAEALAFVAARLDGAAFRDGCATITPASSIAPLPILEISPVGVANGRRGYTFWLDVTRDSFTDLEVTLHRADGTYLGQTSVVKVDTAGVLVEVGSATTVLPRDALVVRVSQGPTTMIQTAFTSR